MQGLMQIHTYIHTHTHIRIHTYIHACLCTHVVCMLTTCHIHTRIYGLHTNLHSHMHTNICAQTFMGLHTYVMERLHRVVSTPPSYSGGVLVQISARRPAILTFHCFPQPLAGNSGTVA
jgi:hypothetical protein